jgi:hypothetical protein
MSPFCRIKFWGASLMFALLFYDINWFTDPENGRPWIALVCRNMLNKKEKKNKGKRGWDSYNYV